jgi:hypothetical protein
MLDELRPSSLAKCGVVVQISDVAPPGVVWTAADVAAWRQFGEHWEVPVNPPVAPAAGQESPPLPPAAAIGSGVAASGWPPPDQTAAALFGEPPPQHGLAYDAPPLPAASFGSSGHQWPGNHDPSRSKNFASPDVGGFGDKWHATGDGPAAGGLFGTPGQGGDRVTPVGGADTSHPGGAGGDGFGVPGGEYDGEDAGSPEVLDVAKVLNEYDRIGQTQYEQWSQWMGLFETAACGSGLLADLSGYRSSATTR